MPNLPSGTVTFVFSDIEGSTGLLKQLGDRPYADLLALHRRLVREIFAAHNGQEIDTQGDAFFYSFTRAREAVAAAVEVQRAHADAKWPEEVEVHLRLGLHTGEPAVGDEGYTGLDVVLASRIAAVGRGGQVLLSDATRAIVSGDLPEGVSLRRLGERRLRDIDRPEPLSELVIPGVMVSAEPNAARAADVSRTPAWPLDPDAPPPPEIPAWVSRAATRFLPEGQTRSLIEHRVLDALNEAFQARDERMAERLAQGRRSHPGRRRRDRGASVSAEIERLRELRETGALTEEQYAKAVDRVIAGED
jgi:class 3 adenylate cyclase